MPMTYEERRSAIVTQQPGREPEHAVCAPASWLSS
jgi:hypothetical protein